RSAAPGGRPAQSDRPALRLPLPHPMSPCGGCVRGADADTGALGGPLLPRRGVPYDDSGFRSQPGGVRLMHGNVVAAAPLLEVQDLSVRFVSREATVTAVNGATFSVRAGEVLCLLGESGSGKSVTLRALMRLLPKQAQVAGRAELGGQDVLGLQGKALGAFRGGAVSMVFQEPMT